MNHVYSRVCVAFFLSVFLTLKVSAQITLSISSSTNVLCYGGNNGSATATVSGGTGPFTYVWNPGGATTATVTNFIAGSYTCTCTDQSDMSTATATVTITQPTLLTATIGSYPSTCGNPNGQAYVNASGGTASYSYLWTPSGSTTPTATGLVAGSYTCTVTDANGCTATATTTVTNQAGPTAIISSQQNATCQGGCNGSAIGTATGGTAPYTFSWSPAGGNAPTANGLCAGSYTLTVTDANGCVDWTSVSIIQPSVGITFTLTPTPSQCSPCSGSIMVSNITNGTPPYSYNWTITSQTTNNPVNLCPATYTCTITDANGCVGNNIATVTLNSNFAATVTPVNSGCTACTGTATANPTGGTGPYTYLWSPGGGTTQTITGLCAGTYSVLVTDATGCQVTANGVVGINTGFSATTSSTPANCWYNTGTGTVNVTGGVPPYTYLWTPSNQTTSTATNLPPGIYHIIVGDQSGCFASVYDT
ncbi:MAG TPA: SprB repeat-containing protein, partial [Bacteroidia bacterium]|nr:SprB repeat-containing protein [Bacteroidia bacterium]